MVSDTTSSSPTRTCEVCGAETTTDAGNPSEFVEITHFVNDAPDEAPTENSVRYDTGWFCSPEHALEWLAPRRGATAASLSADEADADTEPTGADPDGTVDVATGEEETVESESGDGNEEPLPDGGSTGATDEAVRTAIEAAEGVQR